MGGRGRNIIDFNRAGRRRDAAGLMRTTMVGSQPARTLRNLFANLRDVPSGELLAFDSERQAEAVRLRIDRTEGHGSNELYRLDTDLYVISIDLMFDEAREEIVAGEGLIEIHICLRGGLTLQLPDEPTPVSVAGPCLLLLYQPVGVDVSESLQAGSRMTGISLYCRPDYLERLMRRNGIADGGLLAGLNETHASRVWHRHLPLPCGLNYAAASLLQSPYRNGIRLLHAESKVLEILCEILSLSAPSSEGARPVPREKQNQQLDMARHLICTSFSPVLGIREVARAVGMSPSKLKREFHARFGQTVFECGLEARMRRAYELLKTRQMTICQVAYAVGYQHQTSFTAAFRRHFGTPPRCVGADE